MKMKRSYAQKKEHHRSIYGEIADEFATRWIQAHIAAMKEFAGTEEKQSDEAE